MTIALIVVAILLAGFVGYIFGTMNSGNFTLNVSNKSNDSGISSNTQKITNNQKTNTSRNTTNGTKPKPGNNTTSII
ncbi:MAG TPA: hypothetical protein VK444_03465 [Methanobacteriaceae archaeon]|nr:hypothetical protein [Methanobacteriaceae archaeon]